MKLALTGHLGLIGTFLKKRLEKEGHTFILELDKKKGLLLDDLEKMVPEEKIDMFIHAAAHCKINQSISNPNITFESNVLGVHHALEFCRKHRIKKFLFFSSSRILSKEKNPYTASKIYGEELCKAYFDSYGIEYLIIRPSTVYGPFWDETRRLMHIFITNALNGKDLEIYGDPETKTLDFTYVDDFVEGVMLALKGKWNNCYDISGNNEFNVMKLADMIIKKTGSSSKIVIKEAEIAQPQAVSLDISKIKELGYIPRISIEQGVDKTIEFYKSHMKNLKSVYPAENPFLDQK